LEPAGIPAALVIICQTFLKILHAQDVLLQSPMLDAKICLENDSPGTILLYSLHFFSKVLAHPQSLAHPAHPPLEQSFPARTER
jgi:hypothetical protein